MPRKVISVLKEIRANERRVILAPGAVADLVRAGFAVHVEAGAGALSCHDDGAYAAAGARIVDTAAAWSTADLVLKYKAPEPSEWRHFRPGLALACYLHAEGNLPLAEALRAASVRSYAIEFLRTDQGAFPVSVPDSEISGKLAVLLGAYHLQTSQKGRGVLLARMAGVSPPKVVVIGYGNAGGAAAQLAAAMGADVTVFGTSRVGLRRFQALAADNVCCMIQERGAFEQAVLEADLVIGAVLISTYDTPALMDEALVRRMKPGAVIVDVTCGYGAGYMPTFDRLTTHDSPVYERFGVLHCKIDAMPASVPLTATEAMSTTALPYVLALAEDIFCGKSDGVSRAGLVTADGAVRHPEILRHIELERARTGTPRRTEKEEASA